MKTEDVLRIKKLASRIKTIALISQEGRLHELEEQDVIELLDIQKEQACEIERIAERDLKSVTTR